MKMFGAKTIVGFSIAALMATCGAYAYHLKNADPVKKAGIILMNRNLKPSFSYTDGTFTLRETRPESPAFPDIVTTFQYMTHGTVIDMDKSSFVKTIYPQAFGDRSGLQQELTFNGDTAQVQSRRPLPVKGWFIEHVASCISADDCDSVAVLDLDGKRVPLGGRPLQTDEREMLSDLTVLLARDYLTAKIIPVRMSKQLAEEIAAYYSKANMSAFAENCFDTHLQENLRSIDGTQGFYVVTSDNRDAEGRVNSWRYESGLASLMDAVRFERNPEKGLMQEQESLAGKIKVVIAPDGKQTVEHSRTLEDGAMVALESVREAGSKSIQTRLYVTRFIKDSNDIKGGTVWDLRFYGLPPAIFNSFIRTVRTNAAAIEAGAALGPASGMKIAAPPVKPKSGPEMIFVDGLKAGC